jgi:hypothetical protein
MFRSSVHAVDLFKIPSRNFVEIGHRVDIRCPIVGPSSPTRSGGRRRGLPVPSRAGAGNSCPGPAQTPYPGGRVSSELIMIIVELMFAIMLAAAVLIVIPLLLLMAGVAGVVLLWAMAPTAVLVGLVLWLVFPHAMAVAVLVFMLMIGFVVLSRRRQLPMNRW